MQARGKLSLQVIMYLIIDALSFYPICIPSGKYLFKFSKKGRQNSIYKRYSKRYFDFE